MTTARNNVWRRVVSGCAALALLLAVFMLYTRPEFMLVLAQQIWACF